MKTVYTSAFKAQAVLELLKEEKSLSQIAAAYKIHHNILRGWRTAAVRNAAMMSLNCAPPMSSNSTTYTDRLAA
jgi:putative transposase